MGEMSKRRSVTVDLDANRQSIVISLHEERNIRLKCQNNRFYRNDSPEIPPDPSGQD